MLEIIDIGAENVLACKIDGKLELDDIERLKTRVGEILADHEKVRVYVEVESFDGISFSALWEDLKMSFGNLTKLSHKAVVSDKKWKDNMAKIADKISPCIELKQYPLEDRDAAIEWIKS